MDDSIKNETSEKQVLYAKFAPRIFTSMIDIYIVGLAILYPMTFIAKTVFLYIFDQVLIDQKINLNDISSIDKLIHSHDFIFSHTSSFIQYSIILLLIQTLALSCYFIFFWTKFGTTPAKYIFGIRVVNSISMKNLTIGASIIRILGLVTSPIGIWAIFFTKKHQSIHDKFADSIVIKK